MHLLLSVFATEWSFSRFLRDKNKEYAYHIPCLLFLSASLMWFVDSIFEYLEKGTEIFTPNLQDLVQDGFLGLSVIALGILIWQGKIIFGLSSKTEELRSEFSRSFFADSSYMLSFSVLCSCVCSRLISPSVSSWHKQDNTLMHQSPGHIQRRTPYNF